MLDPNFIPELKDLLYIHFIQEAFYNFLPTDKPHTDLLIVNNDNDFFTLSNESVYVVLLINIEERVIEKIKDRLNFIFNREIHIVSFDKPELENKFEEITHINIEDLIEYAVNDVVSVNNCFLYKLRQVFDLKSYKQKLLAFNDTWNKVDLSKQIPTIINKLDVIKHSISNVNYDAIKNDFGIYIFYIKPQKAYTLDTLQQDWEEKEYSKYPKVIKKRFLKHGDIELRREYPFYIGKSEAFAKRIKQHITHSGNTSTYSLKLKGRSFFNEHNITFAYWRLPDQLKECTSEIKQFIITQIESELREKLNPWVGKK